MWADYSFCIWKLERLASRLLAKFWRLNHSFVIEKYYSQRGRGRDFIHVGKRVLFNDILIMWTKLVITPAVSSTFLRYNHSQELCRSFISSIEMNNIDLHNHSHKLFDKIIVQLKQQQRHCIEAVMWIFERKFPPRRRGGGGCSLVLWVKFPGEQQKGLSHINN